MITLTFVKTEMIFYVRHNNGSKTFSVKKHTTEERAKIAAKNYISEYLTTHPEETPRKYRTALNPTARSKTHILGVFKTQYISRGSTVRYYVASIPEGPEGQKPFKKRFNIDTYGEKTARGLATFYRKLFFMYSTEDRLPLFFSFTSEDIVNKFLEENHIEREIGAGKKSS